MTRAERDRLVEANLDLVPKIAGGLITSLPPSFELEDLVQEGMLGLLRAAERFQHVQKAGYTHPVAFRAFAKLYVRGAILDSARRRHYRNATHAPLEDAGDRGELPQTEARIDSRRTARTVSNVVAMLPTRERTVVRQYFGEGETEPAIARRLGVSPACVSQVRRRALLMMRRDLVMRNVRKAAA